MSLTAVPAARDDTWVAALDAVIGYEGADPALVWRNALDEHGEETRGPDGSGEYSSTCPNPGHNGGSGDHVSSLRWSQAPDGQLLFHCHAGCAGDDITTALGLTFTQLKWARTEYVYLSDLREPLAVHVKAPMPGGKKRYWWEHLENGQLVTGRGPAWSPVLWALPDLQHAAERARRDGKRIHLWLCEGEKDAYYTASALDYGWTPEGQGDGWVHLTTTSPDGAAAWSPDLTRQVIDLGAEAVTVVCDSDEAGARRGAEVTETLLESEPTLQIDVISWASHGNVKDAADAIVRFAQGWLREAGTTEDTDAYLWCSSDTGWLFEADVSDLDGHPTGRRALHRMSGVGSRQQRPEAIAKWPVRIVAATIDQQGDPVGWELDLGPGKVRSIAASDLVGSALEAWNARAGLFIVPTRGLGPQLRAYLGHHGQNSPRMSVWEHEGWVANDTFVTGAGVLVGPAGLIGRAEAGITEWHYGEAGPTEAARLVGEVLTFRPLTESAPVLAWLAAVSVRPHALEASGSAFVPMLQVPGDSGTGKTSFLKLATRLFGMAGQAVSNVTTAGLIRTLALSTQVVWIDDFSNYDDTVRDIIRGGITGAGRTRGTTASERGIVRDEARASLVNSGEAAMGLEERAMRQRSVVVPFTERAQGRTSRREGREGRGQYADMVEMGVDREDHGTGLSRWAGSVVRGLYEASCRIRKSASDGSGAGAVFNLTGAEDGVREAAAWRFVEYGSLVLGEWMRSEGTDATRVKRMEQVVALAVRNAVAAAERREKTGADIHLITTLVPAYLRSRRQVSDAAVSGRLHEDENLNGTSAVRVIRDAWRSADANLPGIDGRPARGAVTIVAPDPEGGERVVALALSPTALAEWAQSEEGRRSGIGSDRRFITREGIGMQVTAVASRGPEWQAGGGAAGKIRVKLSAGQSPQYSVVTDQDVIGAVLGA